MVIDATTQNMASLIGLDPELEPVPEPFRMQKDLYIKVPYQTFANYVQHTKLPTNITVIDFVRMKECIYEKQPIIINYYYKYLAVAQCKEISIAQRYNVTEVTKVLPFATSAEEVPLEDVSLLTFETIPAATPMLRELAKYGYPLDFTKPGYEEAQALACYYYSQATQIIPLSLFNITIK